MFVVLKKKQVILFSVFLISVVLIVFVFSIVNLKMVNIKPIINPVVVIDAGHGGLDVK